MARPPVAPVPPLAVRAFPFVRRPLSRRIRLSAADAVFRRRVARLAPRPLPAEGPFEIRLLLGARSLLEAVAALDSFLRFDGATAPVVVHDDGTLGRRGWGVFQRHFPGARLVERAVADRAVLAHLEARRLPRLARLRRSFVLTLKLLDMPMLAGGARVLYFDGDVLFHRAPAELLRALVDPDGRRVDRFNEDVTSSYAWDPARIADRCGVRPLEGVNAGVVAYTPDVEAWPLFEECLRLDPIPGQEWYREQTLWAVALARRGARPLPPEYDVCARHARLGLDVVTQHYCSHQRQFLRERWLAEIDEWKGWPVRPIPRHIGEW